MPVCWTTNTRYNKCVTRRQKRPDPSEFAHLDLLPPEPMLTGSLAKRGVPEWQMLGQPRALADAWAAGFDSDPPPLTNDEVRDGTRPLLFLDFDGVFSPLPSTHLDNYERGQLLFRKGDPNYVYFLAGYGMGSNYWVARELIKAATQLTETFDIVWASTWLFVCRPLGSLVGWPMNLPWVDLGDSNRHHFKAKAIRDLLGDSERTVVWADDHQTPAAQQLLADRPGRTLCIRPPKRSGLRARHLDAILAFPSQSAIEELIDQATQTLGPTAANIWLNSPSSFLHGATPLGWAETNGAVDAIAAIDADEAGTYA